MADRLLGIGLSSWVLDFDRDPFRLPPRSPGLRGPDYEDRFDFTTVYSDVFWDEDGRDVILLSPMLYSLEADLEQKFVALPSGEACAHEVRHAIMLSQTRVPAPAGTQGLAIESAVGRTILAIQPNLKEQFEGRRVITTLSRNNDLQWIQDWARFYTEVHGCDCVLLYDNGSDRYTERDIAEALAEIPGLDRIAVIGWPFPYGAFDVRQPISLSQIDSISCQGMSFEHARRRCLSRARSVLNADIDELAVTDDGRGLFEIVETSSTGFIQFEGLWVENVPSTARRRRARRHRDFHHVKKGRSEVADLKWAVAPERTGREVQWSCHNIFGAVPALEGRAVSLRHFKAINTNWDVDRPADLRDRSLPRLSKNDCESDEALEAAFKKVDWDGRAGTQSRKKTLPLRAAYLNRRDSRVLLDRGEPEKAVGKIRSAISKMPRHPGFHLFLAEALEAAGDTVGAQAARETAEVLRNGDPWFHFQKGRWAGYIGDRDAVRAHYSKAISLDPSSNLAHCVFTKFMITEEKIFEALAVAKIAVKRDPNDIESCLLLARTQNLAGQMEAAAETLRWGAARWPEDETIQRSLGQILLGLRRPDKAEAASRKALSLFRFGGIMAAIGAEANRQGLRVAPSQRALGRLNAAPLHGLLARILVARGKPAAAEEAQRAAIAAKPDVPDAYLAWARILDSLNRQGDADLARQQALDVAKDNFHRPIVVTHGHEGKTATARQRSLQLIRSLVACNELEKAARVAEDARKANPNDPQCRFELAMVFQSMGDFEACVVMLIEAIGLRPCSQQYWQSLRIAQVQKGDLHGAEIAQRKAIELDPKNSLYQHHLGNLLLKQNSLEEAEAAQRRAIELDSSLPGPQRQLSIILDRLGRPEDTVEVTQESDDTNPRN